MAKVLVVDEEMDSILFRRVLEQAGHDCVWTQTAGGMLSYMAHEPIDAVLMAIQRIPDLCRLPELAQLDGIGVVGRITRNYVNGEREAFPFVDTWICLPYEANTTQQAVEEVLLKYARM